MAYLYLKGCQYHTWWHHQMETFSTLLALCSGNSLVTGEFSSQRPVTRSLEVFFDLHLNKQLRKQSWGWRFETPSCSLWHHCNEMPAFSPIAGIHMKIFCPVYHIWHHGLTFCTIQAAWHNLKYIIMRSWEFWWAKWGYFWIKIVFFPSEKTHTACHWIRALPLWHYSV